MNDQDGPEVASALYSSLLSSQQLNIEAIDIPLALDKAVRQLRDQHVHPSRWATFIHIGL